MSDRDSEDGGTMTELSPYGSVGATLVANGYSAIPISPADKMPARFVRGEWWPMKDWSRYCTALPGGFEVRLWAGWPEANVGIACGRGLIAFDIDQDDLVREVLAVLPPCVVGKRGRKGETLFYRGDTTAIRSKGYRRRIPGNPDLKATEGLMDLIADGKQTVIPPSIHPDTAAPYTWTTERTLLDTPIAELSEVTIEHVEAVVEILRAHGWQQAETFKPVEVGRGERGGGSADDVHGFFRKLNEDALANLHAWVPRLGLERLQRSGDGYRSVAQWRPSGSGKPLHKRNLYLSINPHGIVDYGDGEKGYTAINLVMSALDMRDLDRAVVWLGESLGYVSEPLLLNGGRRLLPTRERAHRLYSHWVDTPAEDRIWHTDSEQARRLWSEGSFPLGTPVDARFSELGLSLDPSLQAAVLRYHPAVSVRTDERPSPAILALIRNIHSNLPQGVLALSMGTDTSSLERSRRVFGQSVEGAVKLDEDGAVSVGLTIGYCIEDCIAWRQIGFGPVWSVCLPGNVDRFPVLSGVEALTIITSTEGRNSGRRAAKKCADRWHAAGKTTALASTRLSGGIAEALRRAS